MAEVFQKRRTLLLGAALFALVLVCYLPSVKGGFLWDDDSNVSENTTLYGLEGLFRIWASPFSNQQFYPLTHTSFWIENQIWGMRPTAFRLTNLLLHGLIAVLLWTALRRLAVRGAWAAAAIFALHPVHVETAAWITERKNLLSGAFYFLALLAYLRYAGLDGRDRGGRRTYALALAMFGYGLLAKTAILTLPAALLIIIWWKRGRLTWADIRPTLPLFALGGAFGLLTAWLERFHVGAGGEDWQLSLVERVLVSARSLWFYAAKLVLPVGLNFIYPRWNVGASAIWQWIWPLATVVLPVLLWRHRERIGRGPLAAVLLFGLTVAPALQFFDFYFQIYSFVQDHFQYLASISLIAAIVALASRRLGRVHARAPAVAAAIVLVVLGGLTWQRSKLFVNEERQWTAVLERNPDAWMADINLGLVYEKQGRLSDAMASFENALRTSHSEHDKAHYNTARVLEKLGQYEAAAERYAQAIQLNPEFADAHNALGNLLAEGGNHREAVVHYRAALAIDPNHSSARYNLGLALNALGSPNEAEQQFREAVRRNPRFADAHDMLGRLLYDQGRWVEAAQSYERALALDPNRPETHYNLGLVREQLGDLAAAERHYREAARLDPELALPHNNLAIVLYHTQRYDEAWEEVRRYQQLGGVPHPGFIEALTDASRP